MSLIPEFELGLWNAWILILSFLLSFIVLGVLSARAIFGKHKHIPME